MREILPAARRCIGRILAAFASAAGALSSRDYLMVVGLGLTGYGLSMVYLPAAYLVPGAVLVGVAILGVR